MANNPKVRAWCFTLFVPSELLPPSESPLPSSLEEWQHSPYLQPIQEWMCTYMERFSDTDTHGLLQTLKAQPSNFGGVTFMICQLERSPDTGRLHLQGYLTLDKPTRMQATKQILEASSVHLEPAKGNKATNVTYCSKEESKIWGPIIIGDVASGQGKRNDLDNAIEIIRRGQGLKRVAEEEGAVFVRYNKGLRALHNILADTVPFRNVRVIWHWGTTGTGKTRRAYNLAPNLYSPLQGNGALWWDFYEDQETILFDELSDVIPIELLLRYLDGYHILLPVKGATTVARWTRVFITSNRPPSQIYDKASVEQQEALSRRIHEILHFTDMHVRTQRCWYVLDRSPPTQWPHLSYGHECQLP